MGGTYAGEGYYCGVSERANACVCAGAALSVSCVSEMLLWRHRARVRLRVRTAPRVLLQVAGIIRRCTDRRVVRDSIGMLVCEGPYRDDNAGLGCSGYEVREFLRASEAPYFCGSG